jgi:hypothetical protein
VRAQQCNKTGDGCDRVEGWGNCTGLPHNCRYLATQCTSVSTAIQQEQSQQLSSAAASGTRIPGPEAPCAPSHLHQRLLRVQRTQLQHRQGRLSIRAATVPALSAMRREGAHDVQHATCRCSPVPPLLALLSQQEEAAQDDHD